MPASGLSHYFEEAAESLVVGSPVHTLQHDMPAAWRDAQVRIVLGRLGPVTVRELAAACPDINLVISTEFNVLDGLSPNGRIDPHMQERPGFVGQTLVLHTTTSRYGLGLVKLGLDAAGRVAGAELDEKILNDSIPDAPRIRGLLDRFYERAGREPGAAAGVVPPFADDPLRMNGRYVGASACRTCHQAEYAQWNETSHANAYKTLLENHRHYQPRCVSCHTVGFGARSGYHLGNRDEGLAGVQCEVCHGPGALHAAHPQDTHLARQVPERVCLACHDSSHSDQFNYAAKIALVGHGARAPDSSDAIRVLASARR
jgi:hypothetical protein